jgi:hypothetical protein
MHDPAPVPARPRPRTHGIRRLPGRPPQPHPVCLSVCLSVTVRRNEALPIFKAFLAPNTHPLLPQPPINPQATQTNHQINHLFCSDTPVAPPQDRITRPSRRARPGPRPTQPNRRPANPTPISAHHRASPLCVCEGEKKKKKRKKETLRRDRSAKRADQVLENTTSPSLSV